MKTIPLQLLNQYAKPGGSYCYLAKVVDRDGNAFGFTTLDANVLYDDGFHVVNYSSRQELRPQKLQSTSDYDAINTDLLGWFNIELEKLILAGMFDRAELTLYRVAYLKLEAGAELLAYGTVGEVDFAASAKGTRKIEFLGLKDQLHQVVNEMYSLTCRAQFGDDRCKMPFSWQSGQVSAVGGSPFLAFSVSGEAMARPAGYYEFGVIEFLSGDNTGAELEVEGWGSSGQTQLSFLAPYPVKVGDQLRIRRDCGKTETDCKGYNNIINMRAEHLTPVENAAIMVPGAYIKSVGAE